MAVVAPVITAYFDLASQDETLLHLDDATLGLLDTGGVLGGDIAEVINGKGFAISVHRGRDVELDEITAGTCRISFRNHDRTFDPSYTAGPYFGNIVPGKRVEVSIYGVTIFTGQSDDWDDQYPVDGNATVSLLCVDALGNLARQEFDEWTTTSQLPGARITAVLDRDEVRYSGGRDLDDGVETLQADLVTWGSNALNYLQLVSLSDLGRLFASRTGLLTFRDRLSLAVSGIDPVATFADDGTGYKFNGVAKRTPAELLYTWISVDRVGGTAQSATDETAITAYGIRRLSRSGLLLNDDTRSQDMADYLITVYATPQDRIAALVVNVSGYTSQADQAFVSSLEIGDVVEVVWTPQGVGAAITKTVIVEGVAHDIHFDGSHVMSLALSEFVDAAPFILDDAELGLLDTAGVLAF